MNKTLAFALLFFALQAGAQQVRYRSADTVYLTSGSAAGVAVGDRFEIVRNDTVIGTVEVIFVAENSASARVVRETSTIAAGDGARRVGAPLRVPPTAAEASPPPAGLPSAAPGMTAAERAPRAFGLAGTASFDAESGDGDGRSLGRLSLRARNLGNLPLHARIRTRLSSVEDGNRLYAANVAYEGERIGVQAGRIGNAPAIGLGYLDGILVRLSITDHVQAGAFGGLQPDIHDLSLDAEATKFGAYVRLFSNRADLTVAGATVEDHPFAAVDGRWLATERVTLFAHGRAGDESFNTMVGGIGQLSPRQSVSVAYERVDPGPDDDLRTTDQVINDFLRQGLRVTYRGPYAILGAGLRSGDEDDDPTYSATAGLAHPNLFGLYAGITATGFSSAITDGVFTQFRAGRTFGAGHNAELSAGALLVDENGLEEITATAYLRGALWLELPYDLFGRAEVELASGDARGHRITLGAGYRF